MLQLKKLGIDDLVHFDFMDPPGMNSQRIFYQTFQPKLTSSVSYSVYILYTFYLFFHYVSREVLYGYH